MIDASLLAAVIAFVACFIAVSRLSRVNPRERRRLSGRGRRFVASDLSSLKGPPMKQWLAGAGYYRSDAAVIYTAVTIGAALLGAILGGAGAAWAELGTYGILAFALAGGVVFSRLPSSHVNAQWSARSKRIASAFPLMLDMLEVCASSGMSLDESWNTVRGQVRVICPELSDEMQLVELEVRLGQGRGVALQALAERTGVGDAAALATLLEQSERLGSGLAETFKGQASAMRKDYELSLEENAHRMAVTAILPVVLLMAPAFFVVTVLPMGIVIVRTLTGLDQ